MKRGVELSLNTIILIVLGLIAAGILIYLLSSTAGKAKKDMNACEAKGGHCAASASECTKDEQASTFFTGGCEKQYGDDAVCCIKRPW